MLQVSIDNKSLHESCHESEDSGKCVRLNSTADDEHQHFAILHDEIDFTALATEIPFQQVQALLLQIDQGLIFT